MFLKFFKKFVIESYKKKLLSELFFSTLLSFLENIYNDPSNFLQ